MLTTKVIKHIQSNVSDNNTQKINILSTTKNVYSLMKQVSIYYSHSSQLKMSSRDILLQEMKYLLMYFFRSLNKIQDSTLLAFVVESHKKKKKIKYVVQKPFTTAYRLYNTYLSNIYSLKSLFFLARNKYLYYSYCIIYQHFLFYRIAVRLEKEQSKSKTNIKLKTKKKRLNLFIKNKMNNLIHFNINSLGFSNNLLTKDLLHEDSDYVYFLWIKIKNKYFTLFKKEITSLPINFNYLKYITFFNTLSTKLFKMSNIVLPKKRVFKKNNTISTVIEIVQSKQNSFFLQEYKKYVQLMSVHYLYSYNNKRIIKHIFSMFSTALIKSRTQRLLLKKKLTFFLDLGSIGTISIKHTWRNVFFTLSDFKGNHLYHLSSGMLKVYGKKKVFSRTIYNLSRRFLQKIHFFFFKYNIHYIQLKINGIYKDVFHFIRPFFKRCYYYQQWRYYIKKYALFIKKYLFYKKEVLINKKHFPLKSINHLQKILFKFYNIIYFFKLKRSNNQEMNYTLLYIKLRNKKSFIK